MQCAEQLGCGIIKYVLPLASTVNMFALCEPCHLHCTGNYKQKQHTDAVIIAHV